MDTTKMNNCKMAVLAMKVCCVSVRLRSCQQFYFMVVQWKHECCGHINEIMSDLSDFSELFLLPLLLYFHPILQTELHSIYSLHHASWKIYSIFFFKRRKQQHKIKVTFFVIVDVINLICSDHQMLRYHSNLTDCRSNRCNNLSVVRVH